MKKRAPKSYRNTRRLPLLEALALEGGSDEEAADSLERKGYFEPPPRPWKLGFDDRGQGRKSFAVLDRFGDLVVEVTSQSTAKGNMATAQLIMAMVNAYLQPRRKK